MTSPYNYDVIEDATGKRFPNLVGVFHREFPIVAHQVVADRRPPAVTYYGDHFTIWPRNQGE